MHQLVIKKGFTSSAVDLRNVWVNCAEILNNLNSVVKRMLKELLSQKFLLLEPKELQADVSSQRLEDYGATLCWNKLLLHHTFKMFGQVDKRKKIYIYGRFFRVLRGLGVVKH